MVLLGFSQDISWFLGGLLSLECGREGQRGKRNGKRKRTTSIVVVVAVILARPSRSRSWSAKLDVARRPLGHDRRRPFLAGKPILFDI